MSTLVNYLFFMIITVIWGYFKDLKYGEVNWFIGRLIFSTVVFFLVGLIIKIRG